MNTSNSLENRIITLLSIIKLGIHTWYTVIIVSILRPSVQQVRKFPLYRKDRYRARWAAQTTTIAFKRYFQHANTLCLLAEVGHWLILIRVDWRTGNRKIRWETQVRKLILSGSWRQIAFNHSSGKHHSIWGHDEWMLSLIHLYINFIY